MQSTEQEFYTKQFVTNVTLQNKNGFVSDTLFTKII